MNNTPKSISEMLDNLKINDGFPLPHKTAWVAFVHKPSYEGFILRIYDKPYESADGHLLSKEQILIEIDNFLPGETNE